MWVVLLRFVLAGTVVTAAPILANRIGPAAAGLLLAFPTIITLGLVGVGMDGGGVATAARTILSGLLALAGYATTVTVSAPRTGWPAAIMLGILTWSLVAAAIWQTAR